MKTRREVFRSGTRTEGIDIVLYEPLDEESMDVAAFLEIDFHGNGTVELVALNDEELRKLELAIGKLRAGVILKRGRTR